MEIFVETERLILREILPSDVDSFYELDSNPEVHKYLGNKPITSKQEAVAIIDFIRKQYVDNGIGRWAMIEKKTGEFIGWSGLKLETIETNNHINYYDLGYRLRQEYWGKGYALESAVASLKYAFEKLNVSEVNASADCDNIGSNKILQKIGLKFIESFYFDQVKQNWYGITKDEYQLLVNKL